MRERREILCIRRVMADQDPVGLQDEMNLSGNEFDDFYEMGPVKGGLVTTYADLMKSFFSGNGGEISSHLLWRMEAPHLFRLSQDVPRPAIE